MQAFRSFGILVVINTAIFIVGLVLVVAGLALIIFAPKPKTEVSGAKARSLDPEKILEQVNKLLAQLDKRYRIGAFVMLVGVALIGVGAYLEALDAKDEAEQAAAFLSFF